MNERSDGQRGIQLLRKWELTRSIWKLTSWVPELDFNFPRFHRHCHVWRTGLIYGILKHTSSPAFASSRASFTASLIEIEFTTSGFSRLKLLLPLVSPSDVGLEWRRSFFNWYSSYPSLSTYLPTPKSKRHALQRLLIIELFFLEVEPSRQTGMCDTYFLTCPSL